MYLSNSQLGTWLRCPRQWMFSYVKKIKNPPGGALIQGSAYHKGLETNFQHKINTGDDLPVGEVLDAVDTFWNNRLQGREEDRNGNMVSVEDVKWDEAKPAKLKDDVIKVTKMYCAQISPRVDPIKVEQKYIKEFDGITFIGYVDLITSDNAIIDHKLKGKRISDSDADSDIQPLSYGLLTGNSDFVYHVGVKKAVPEIQVVSLSRTAGEIAWWKEAIVEIAQQMQAGVFPPNPIGWHCSERFCGYWNLCKGGARNSE